VDELKNMKCWRNIVVEDDLPIFDANVIGIPPGTSGYSELRLRRKTGEEISVSSFVECVPDPNSLDGLRLYGGLVDITDRKQAEEAQKISELRYRRLFESAQDGILILDFDTGKILDVNPYLTDMLGYTHEGFLGKYAEGGGKSRRVAVEKCGTGWIISFSYFCLSRVSSFQVCGCMWLGVREARFLACLSL
ncbi:MAG: hypothetical protein QG577_2028, partial [Thermodesulfobacteriota bacterium]|nr:hypothetical protein [Thermodesulfobacteriota bacterium]